MLSLNPSNSTKRKIGTIPKNMGIKVSIKTHLSPSIVGKEPYGLVDEALGLFVGP